MSKYNELNEEEKRVILEKGTERPFTGEYNDFIFFLTIDISEIFSD